MQRKFHLHVKGKAAASANNDRDKGSIRAKPARTLVGSLLSSVLGSGNKISSSLGKYPSKLANRKKGGKEWGKGNKLGRGGTEDELPVVAASLLSQLLKLDQPDPAVDHEGIKGKQNNRKGIKQRVKMNNIPLLSFLDHKKKGQVMRRKVSCSWRLIRIRIRINPSKILVINRLIKLKMIRSLMMKKKVEQGADEDDRELCKKRILMGGRCKPLCSSGTLTYDADALFFP